MMPALVITAFVCALIPCLLYLRNVQLYRLLPPASDKDGPLPPVSVLIPARDEDLNIRAAVESVLAARGVDVEVLVLDDHSSDGTAAIVQEIAARDRRVRLIEGKDLPPGWCGKNHALQQLADAAAHELMIFMDADVRLEPPGPARLAAFMRSRPDTAAASGIPRQITAGPLEQLLIPLIHWVLLAFLPMKRMRRTTNPAASAAIGQLLICRRTPYLAAGGHAAIKDRIHDAMALVRSLRIAGHKTDLFDPFEIASVRMYESAGSVWRGFVKNAAEGLGHPRLIGFITLFFLAGQILPCILRFTIPDTELGLQTLAAWALFFAFLPRLLAALRFRQPFLGVAFHPIAVILLLIIQWEGLIRHVRKRPVPWKGRTAP